MAAGQWDEAQNEVSQALAALEGAEAPLAEWRVCATAGRLYEQLGRATEAAHNLRRSAGTIKRLADSLGGAVPLRQSLLNGQSAQAAQML
jgi:hypothetical protein